MVIVREEWGVVGGGNGPFRVLRTIWLRLVTWIIRKVLLLAAVQDSYNGNNRTIITDMSHD